MHAHYCTSMIIFVIDRVSIFPHKSKSQSPIPADLHGPGSFAVSFYLMKIQPWEFISAGATAALNRARINRNLSVCWARMPDLVRVVKELFQSLMLETPNHPLECNPTW